MDSQRSRGAWGVVLAALFLFLSCATLRSWLALDPPLEYAPAPDASVPEAARDAGLATAPVWIQGPLLRAAYAAVHYEVSHYERLHDENPQLEQWYRCMSRLDTYDAQIIQEEPGRWFVFVIPIQDRCGEAGPGGRLITGGATYEVSKQDFRILSAQQWEG